MAPAQRFSNSPIWELQAREYERLGPRAWTEEGLPTLVTTSAYMARAYAEVLLDWAEATPGEGPRYVIELGSGPGILAARLARALARARLPHSPPVVVVLTDLARANVLAWQADPLLRRLAEAGQVDFARLDLRDPGPLRLALRGEVLDPAALDQPVALVANYVLDSLPCDLFLARAGRLHEVEVTHAWSEEARAWTFSLRPEEAPLAGPAYGDPELDALLDRYARGLDEAWPLFPAPFLKALRRLLPPAGGLLLCADKGFRHLHEWQAAGVPYIASHGRAFSVQANLDAVGAFVEGRGGLALHGASAQTHLTISAFALGLDPRAASVLRRSFSRFLDDAGPVDRHRLLGAGVDPAELPLRPHVAALRVADADPFVFIDRVEVILPLAPTCPADLREDLRALMIEVEARAVDLAGLAWLHLHLGRLSFALGLYDEATGRFLRSLEEDGEHPATCYNLHLCAEALGDTAEARAWLDRALAIEPDFAPALEALTEALTEALAEARAPG